MRDNDDVQMAGAKETRQLTKDPDDPNDEYGYS